MSPSRFKTSWTIGALILTTGACAGGASEGDVAKYREQLAQFAPTVAALKAMNAQLPAPGSERATACAGTIPTAGLETLSEAQLKYLLDQNDGGEHGERLRLTSGPFTVMDSTKDAEARTTSDALPGEIINDLRALQTLGRTKRVGIFRPSRVEIGSVGVKADSGDYIIEKPAVWSGWLFVFSLGEKPALEAAFPVTETNAASITFMKKQGYRPPANVLIDNALGRVRNRALQQLGLPNCQSAVTANTNKCEAGDAVSCFEVGGAYHRGSVETAQDHDAAAKWYDRGCALGNGDACFHQGQLLSDGQHLVKDLPRAAAVFRKGCDAGQAKACHALGGLLSKGDGVERDEAGAAAVLLKGCDGGLAAACNDLAILYGAGRGVAKDEAAAAKLFKVACDAKLMVACANLGDLYNDGRGVAKSFVDATRLFQEACLGGHKKACQKRATL